MAVRNSWFRIALVAFAASYLLLSAEDLIRVVDDFRDYQDVEAKIGVLIELGAHLVHAGGLAVLAAAFGPRIDWRRLKVGAVVVGAAYLATFVSTIVFLPSTFNGSDLADHRTIYIWTAVGAGLAVIAAGLIVAGLLKSRRGPDLAPLLQIGLAFGALSVGAAATSIFHEWSLYSSQAYVSEYPVGTLIAAIAQGAIAICAMALVLGIRRPLPRREKCLAAAAVGITLASFCDAVGQLLISLAFSTHGARTSDDLVAWLGVGFSLFAVAGYASVALGARSAGRALIVARTVSGALALARRNLDFWIAALVTAGAYLVLEGDNVLEAVKRFEVHHISFGLYVASAVKMVAPLVGAGGWVIVATALAAKIDWRRLRLGAAIVVCAYVATYAASVLEALDFHGDPGAIEAFYIWTSIGAFLIAVGALVVFSGFGDSRRGAARGLRLQIGLAFASASAAAVAVAIFNLHSYFDSRSGFDSEHRIGALVIAIGQIALALAILFFALEARSPLPRRERMLFRTAAAAAFATLCLAVGQGLIAYAYTIHGELEWRDVVGWLAAAYPFVSGVAIAFVASGARSAQEETAGSAPPHELALDRA